MTKDKYLAWASGPRRRENAAGVAGVGLGTRRTRAAVACGSDADDVEGRRAEYDGSNAWTWTSNDFRCSHYAD